MMTNSSIGNTKVQLYPCGVLSGVTCRDQESAHCCLLAVVMGRAFIKFI